MKKDSRQISLKRLKIARGHLERVIKMVDEGKYCIDVLQQSMAVQSSLKRVDEMILENHLKVCIEDSLRKGKNKLIKEIVEIFRKGRR